MCVNESSSIRAKAKGSDKVQVKLTACGYGAYFVVNESSSVRATTEGSSNVGRDAGLSVCSNAKREGTREGCEQEIISFQAWGSVGSDACQHSDGMRAYARMTVRRGSARVRATI